jgi:diacylglycerol O-acyltransferase
MAPVSLREEGDLDSANAVGFITADLATNIADPEKRIRAIQESMRAGKDLLAGMSSREAALFMQLTQLPAILTSVLGLAATFPAFSTVISNVPGPREQLFWNGASLDGIYPASIVFDGFAMNITLVSYHKSLDFGIVACRRSLPQIQRIIDYLEDALQELEVVAGLRRAPAKKKLAAGKSKRTTAAGKKTAAKKKTSAKSAARRKAKSPAKGAARKRKPAGKKAAAPKRKKAAAKRPKARAKTKARKAVKPKLAN